MGTNMTMNSTTSAEASMERILYNVRAVRSLFTDTHTVAIGLAGDFYTDGSLHLKLYVTVLQKSCRAYIVMLHFHLTILPLANASVLVSSSQ